MSDQRHGVVEFQLYLLRTMNPPPSLLTSSLSALNYSHEQMETVYQQISTKIRPDQNARANLQTILGEAKRQDTTASDLTDRYSLPLWPNYIFEALFDDTGHYILRANFTHPEQGEKCIGEIAPWKTFKGDIRILLEEVEEIDTWGHYATYSALNRSSGKRHFLRFAWQLLQESEVLAD